MYRVFIDFKDGSHKEDFVATEPEADVLKTKWEAEGEYHEAGFFLTAPAEAPA
jgi:hypothetical protein